jgi:hypothetical protein
MRFSKPKEDDVASPLPQPSGFEGLLADEAAATHALGSA